MAQFLIMVPVPEVETHVARLRARFDPSAARGLGAHVTIVHSNLPSEPAERGIARQIATAVPAIAPFAFQITRVARFPGTLYLAAEPIASFALARHALLQALAKDGGQRAEEQAFIPHVSVVRKSAADHPEVEAELATTLQRHGPIRCACTRLVLLENSSGLWRPMQEFALSGDTDSPWQAPA